MLKILKRVSRAIASFIGDVFAELDFSPDREAAASAYARQRHAMLFGAGQELPTIQKVRSDEAMRLSATGAQLYNGSHVYFVNVFDDSRGSYPPHAQVFGDTAEQAEARARQLVSALDGARRL